MLRQLTGMLPSALRASSMFEMQTLRGFRAVADVEINLNDRETLKKYVGVRDHVSKEPASKGKLIEAIRELLEAAKVLPESSDYRRVLEATGQYRLKVCEANQADSAIEEVLDAHLEELIEECKEEMRLIPVMADTKPWDVDPATYQVPVFNYEDASTILNQAQAKK